MGVAKKNSAYKDFNHEQIDRLMQNRLRLAILAALLHSEEVDFTSLRNAVNTKDGNLSPQLKLLEDSGLISMSKTFVNRRPQTNIALTTPGRHALLAFKKILDEWLTVHD